MEVIIFPGAAPIPAGKYIVIEGADGAGKTTQVEMLKDHLADFGIVARVVREPGGDPFAEQLRASILDPSHEVTPLAQHFAFQAARTNLRERVIMPLLQSGVWVLADRSEASTLVYQCYAGGLDTDIVWRDIDVVQRQSVAPDTYLMLDIDANVQAQRRPTLDEGRFELAGDDFRRQVIDGYRWVVQFLNAQHSAAHLLDGRKSQADVHTAICQHLQSMLP